MQQEKYKKKAYIFPRSKRNKNSIYNPYIDNFIASTRSYIDYLNENHRSGTGIFNIFSYLRKIDLLMLNWIEDLPDKKGGYLQSVFFLLLIRALKLLNVKIVWTLHNKFFHSTQNQYLKKKIFFTLLKKSDLIITHSREGIKFAGSLTPGVEKRMFYFPHPVVPVNGKKKTDLPKKYDILIWGTLAPYKAIDLFLEYLSANNALDRYRILIAGKANPAGFYDRLRKFESDSITIKNQYIDNVELAEMISQSKVVLFTYSGNSVLSSGALTDSVSHGATIIGPDTGAFSDLGHAGIIKTYTNHQELLSLFDLIDQQGFSDNGMINEFIRTHTWEKFSESFGKKLESIS
jgi:beta-1,4-mannosyltransferase